MTFTNARDAFRATPAGTRQLTETVCPRTGHVIEETLRTPSGVILRLHSVRGKWQLTDITDAAR